jgi:hypothetical protein
MGIQNPPPVSFQSLNEGEMKNFYKDSKKVSNAKIIKDLKVKLYFSTYKEGFEEILNNIL